MIRVFAAEESEIQVSVITFGGESANLHLLPQPAAEIEWVDLHAGGRTPLGSALSMVREVLEDKEKIPSRAYTPTLVLVSDGIPTDNWSQELQKLLDSDRAKKAMRLAMGIGGDVDTNVLERFINNVEILVFTADQASQVSQFFKWVTMSVTSRTRSSNPNQILLPTFDEDDLDALG